MIFPAHENYRKNTVLLPLLFGCASPASASFGISPLSDVAFRANPILCGDTECI